MLHVSGVQMNLSCVAFYNDEALCIYGDPAYPLSVHLQEPFKGAQLTPEMVAYNRACSD